MKRGIGPAAAYLVACVAAAVFILMRLSGGHALDTDIQSMLPAGALKPPVREAMVQAGAAASSRIALLVTSDDPERARKAAASLQDALKKSGVFVDSAVDGEQTARWLFANRNELSCELKPGRLGPEQVDSIIQTSIASLYSPVAPVSGEMLTRDPFLLTLRLSGCLLPANGFGQGAEEGAILLSGRLTGSAYRLDTQDQVVKAVDDWSQGPDGQGVTLARAGAAFHAQDGAKHARGDVSKVGLASTLGIIALLLVVFRRLKVLPIALLVVGAGYLGSFAAVLAVFPHVHMLTFVFGAAFVGVTADYAIYYLATGPMTGWADAEARRKLIFRPVTICMVTSAIGFGCLALFHVPIFSQMAVFAGGGLVSAWLCAFTLVPLLDPAVKEARRDRLSAIWTGLDARLASLRWNTVGLALFGGAFLLAAVIGVARFSTLDDVRRFQPRSPTLVAEENQVRAAAGVGFSPNFLLTSGPTLDAAKDRESQILASLPAPSAKAILAVSRFDPGATRRAQNLEQLKTNLFQPHLAERAALLGADPADLQPFAAGAKPPLPQWLASLEGRAGSRSFLIAPVPEEASIAVQGAVRGQADAFYIDPAAAYSKAFADYRHAATGAVIAAFLAIALILLAVYRSFRALSILIAPALGAVGGVVAASALGVPLSFFSIMGIFVVVGTGADYSILRWEAARGRSSPLGGLPVLTTALTAILSMGLLSLSGTYPVRSFGISVAAGLTISYAFSFIAGRLGKETGHGRQT